MSKKYRTVKAKKKGFELIATQENIEGLDGMGHYSIAIFSGNHIVRVSGSTCGVPSIIIDDKWAKEKLKEFLYDLERFGD